MRLSSINRVIVEGYSRTVDADYTRGKQVTDPRPNIVVLGRWVNHKGTKLLCGLNLNYLNEEQVLRLRTNLSKVLGDRNVRRRVRMIRSLMPDIFNMAYRTYNSDVVNIIKPGTLKFFKPQNDEDQAIKGGEEQQIVQPLPIVKPSEKPSQKPSQKAQPKPAGPDFSGLETDSEPEMDVPEMGTPNGIAQSIKSRHDRMRGDTAKKAQKEVDKADDIKRSEIKKDLKGKLEKEIENKDIEKIGTDDIDALDDEQDDGQDSEPK